MAHPALRIGCASGISSCREVGPRKAAAIGRRDSLFDIVNRTWRRRRESRARRRAGRGFEREGLREAPERALTLQAPFELLPDPLRRLDVAVVAEAGQQRGLRIERPHLGQRHHRVGFARGEPDRRRGGPVEIADRRPDGGVDALVGRQPEAALRLGDALKFRGDEPPRVHVASRQEGNDWQFSVSDNGIGIPPEHRQRVFLVFQRLHGRGQYEGTGIGLAICKRIVERHHGRIWIGEKSGSGSVFHFTLPSSSREGDQMNQGESEPAVDILLVEDNPADVRLTQEALREGKLRNSLTVAETGEKALAMLSRRLSHADSPRPDLILLDLNLPGRSGREVLAEIKADPDLKRIPVVILTTSKAEEDVVKSYNLHANAYITKPVDLDKFMQVVRTIESFWLTVVVLPPQ